MPNTRALRRRRATSSSEYGSTDDSTAMPKPLGDGLAGPGRARCARPNGRTTTSATAMARASPSSRGTPAPLARWRGCMPPSRRPRARPVPARSTAGRPAASRRREMSTTPTAAAPTATRSRSRRARTVARVSGPRNSTVTATPMGSRAEGGVEGEVHQPQGRARTPRRSARPTEYGRAGGSGQPQRIAVANSNRSVTDPGGADGGTRVAASAPPNWTEATAARTSTRGGAGAPGVGAAACRGL